MVYKIRTKNVVYQKKKKNQKLLILHPLHPSLCTLLISKILHHPGNRGSYEICTLIYFFQKKKTLLSYYSVCTLYEENFSIQACLKSPPNWKSYKPTATCIKLCSSITTFLSHSSLYPQQPIKSNCPFVRIIRLINSHNFNHWSSLFANVVGLLLFFEVRSLFSKLMFFLCSLNLCCLLCFIFSFFFIFIFIFLPFEFFSLTFSGEFPINLYLF